MDITIEDASFAELAAASRAAGLTSAEFARRATVAAIRLHKAKDAARRDETGYINQPVQDDEFAIAEEDLLKGDDET